MSPERIAGGCRQLQKAGLRLGPDPAGRAHAACRATSLRNNYEESFSAERAAD